jgi:hypothetical protein
MSLFPHISKLVDERLGFDTKRTIIAGALRAQKPLPLHVPYKGTTNATFFRANSVSLGR